MRVNTFWSIIIALSFISIIYREIKYIKEIQVATKKSVLEILPTIIAVCFIVFSTYKYANNLLHYFMGVIGIILVLVMFFKMGITQKGFVSRYRYKYFISWDEIEKFDVSRRKNVKITVFGKFMEQSFEFRNEDYDKVMQIIKDNL